MSKKSISIMIVPHTEARVYNFRLPVSLIYFTFLSLFILVVAMSLLMLDYHQVKKSVAQLAPLNEQLLVKNSQLETDRNYQTMELQKLNKFMGRLKRFDNKLRIMTGLEVREESINLSANVDDGKGGPDVDGDDSVLRKLKEELAQSVSDAHLEKEAANNIKVLKEKTLIRYQSFEELEEHLENQKTALSRTPSVWPLKGWVKEGFGTYISPFTGYEQEHKGVDIIARSGTPVSATADGRVIFSGKDGDYGLKVVIDHGYGYQTTYSHNYVNKVKRGEFVTRGQIIATCGSSGRSTGPHLFYAVKVKGEYVDPMTYMLN